MKLVSQFKSSLSFQILKRKIISNNNINVVYKKIYNFNRKKWQDLKNKIFTKNGIKNVKKKISLETNKRISLPFSNLINPFKLQIIFKKWKRLKMYYKLSLNEKRKVNLNYANSLRLRKLKTLVNNNSQKYTRFSIYKNVIIKLEYHLDVFLYKLKVFPYLFSVRSEIQKGNIYVNNIKMVKYTYVLQKGDIISFSENLNFDFTTVSRKVLHRSRLLSIIEFDLYNKQIIILKNFSELTREDLFSFNLNYINLNYLLFYLKKN